MDNDIQAGAAAPMAPPKPPKVRMDRGREFASVHGERAPEDPFKHVHFMQDGLPFDAHGHMLLTHPMITADTEEAEQLRRIVDKKIRRQLTLEARAAARKANESNPDADAEAEFGDDEDEAQPQEVNLSMWLRGEQDVVWNEVTQHIARRYKKRVNSIGDAVAFLVEQGVAPANAVAKKFKKHLD